MKELILGGARSGKSHEAEKRAQASGKIKIILATATAGDGEMAQRIAHHQTQRGEQWRTVEEPIYLAAALERVDSDEHVVVIDCLTLWLSQSLIAGVYQQEKTKFLTCISRARAHIIIVSNEVGSGIVPMGELSRTFVDECGRLHQELAQLCDSVSLVVAGIPLKLKPQ